MSMCYIFRESSLGNRQRLRHPYASLSSPGSVEMMQIRCDLKYDLRLGVGECTEGTMRFAFEGCFRQPAVLISGMLSPKSD